MLVSRGLGLQKFKPTDFVIFFITSWIGSHTDGERWPAAQTAACMISFLATTVDKFERSGEWQPQLQLDNPLRSLEVQKLKKGYNKHVKGQGQVQRSAKPWNQDTVDKLVVHLYIKIREAKGLQLLLC